MRQFLMNIDRSAYIEINKYTLRICKNNQKVIKLINNSQIYKRFKHINVAVHFIRELIEFKKIKLRYVKIDKIIADGLTKPLTKDSFERFRSMLGFDEF